MSLAEPNELDFTIPPVGLMDVSQRKQAFSKAYVRAVASAAGYDVYQPETDDDSVDIGVSSRAKHGIRRGPRIEAQLKCTSQDIQRDDKIRFRLDLKNYNDLRDTSILVPRILIVMVVPEDFTQWINCDSNQIVMQKRVYWSSLYGMAAISTESTTIDIQTKHVFNTTGLHKMMNLVGNLIEL